MSRDGRDRPDDGFALEVVSDAAGFAALAGEWPALHARTRLQASYTRHGWLLQCWGIQAARPGTRLHVIVVRLGGRPVLALPLVRRARPLGFHTLSLLDSGTPFYADMLAEASEAGAAAARLVAARLAAEPLLIKFRCNYVHEAADLHLLLDALPTRRRALMAAGEIDLGRWESPAAYLAGLSRSLRRDHRDCARALSAMDGRVCRLLTPEAVDRAIDWMFATKAAQLARRGELGSWFNAPGTVALYREAARRGLADGSCVVFALEAAGRLLAAELAFVGNRTLLLSKSAYGDDLKGRSPGTYLRLELIMAMMKEGISRVDLMVGEYGWKTRMRTGTCSVGHYRVPGRLVALLGGR